MEVVAKVYAKFNFQELSFNGSAKHPVRKQENASHLVITAGGITACQDWLNFYIAFEGQPLTLICEKSVDYVDTFHEMLVPSYSCRNR